MKRLALGIAACLFASVPLFAQTQPLAGVRKVTVDVHLAGDTSGTQIRTDRLRTVVELRLRTAGLKVLTETEDKRDPETNPTVLLVLQVTAVPPPGNEMQPIAYVSYIELSAEEWRTSQRNGAPVWAVLHRNAIVHQSAPASVTSNVESSVNTLLDDLLNDWLKANPKR